MWLISISLCLLALLTFVLYIYLRWNFNYWSKRHVIGPQPQLLVGNFPKSTAGKCNFLEELHEIYLAYKEKQRFVGIFTARDPKLFILDPSLAAQILIQHFQSFHDNESSKWTTSKVEQLRPCSPFVSTAEAWKEKRADLAGAVTTSRLRSSHSALLECAAKMRSYIEAQGPDPLDAKELANRFTAQFMANFIWSIEANAFAETPLCTVQRMANNMIEQSLACVRYFCGTAAFPLVRRWRPTRFFPAHTDRFFQKLAVDVLEMRRQHDTMPRSDVLSHLLQLRAKKTLSDTQIAGYTTTVLIDGFETGAILIAHCLLLLSRHERVQQKLRAELATLEGGSAASTFDTLNELPYLEQCLQETLRIFPPLPTLFKLCTKRITLQTDGPEPLTLQPGHAVYISSYSFHRDADYFEHPEEFWPERFDAKSGLMRKYRDMGVFLPFGDGPRICPGSKLGLAEAKVAVADVISHFKVRCGDKTRKDNKIEASSFLLCLEGGIELIFEKLVN